MITYVVIQLPMFFDLFKCNILYVSIFVCTFCFQTWCTFFTTRNYLNQTQINALLIMSLQQNKNLKKPPPAPALRKHSALIAAAKKHSAVAALSAAAAASTKRSARAALKDND